MTTTADTAALRAAMVEQLTARDSPWRAAMANVPRHLFVPCFHQQQPGGQWETIASDDDRYWPAVYADRALTTQLTDGQPTSSSSQPSLMLTMLDALDVHDGHRVLEIGTGTGYNAALLTHRLGDQHVTTIDVDPALTGPAAERLAAAGYQPSVLTRDGALGAPDRAPFDRIIATCGMTSIPLAWLAQATDGAVIVAPIGYGLARLTVTGDRADGRFLPGGACFMPRRTDSTAPRFDRLDQATPRATQVPLAAVVDRLQFPLSLALPGYSWCTWSDDRTGETQAVGLWIPDGSTARACHDGTVRETGPCRLWAVVEELHELFPAGPPALDDFGLTVMPDHQRAWYRTPDGPGWNLPASLVR
jgi:protein-L-isoaspartate O-methyltransferase